MNDRIKSYIALLEQYLNACRDLLLFEKEKRKALLDNDLKAIEGMLQSQQASIMRLNNFEKKRMALQSELGFADMSSEEVLKAIGSDSEAAERLRSVFRDLKSTVVQIREYNHAAVEFARKSLKLIELMSQSNSGDETAGVYGPAQTKEGRSGKTMEKMI